MTAILKQELKLNLKNLLIWSLTVGFLGLVCTLLYTSMEGEMAAMADTFSQLGAFSDAFGMSTLSIATLSGFFASEVGTVHGLGSAMFAATLASCMLSKEEEGHTGEFLYSLPMSRSKVMTGKALAILIDLVVFTVICGVFYVCGFVAQGEELPTAEMAHFLGAMLLMNIEIGAISYLLSAASSRNRMGLGLGIALIAYTYDLMGRVVPDLKDYLFIGPFSYTNAAEIFAAKEIPASGMLLAVALVILSMACAYRVYNRRDLAG